MKSRAKPRPPTTAWMASIRKVPYRNLSLDISVTRIHAPLCMKEQEKQTLYNSVSTVGDRMWNRYGLKKARGWIQNIQFETELRIVWGWTQNRLRAEHRTELRAEHRTELRAEHKTELRAEHRLELGTEHRIELRAKHRLILGPEQRTEFGAEHWLEFWTDMNTEQS